MRKLVEFHALGLDVVPWSVPDIGTGTARDGRRYRFARRGKKSRLALGRGSLEDWQRLVAACAAEAWGGRPLHTGPIRLHAEFLARTPAGRRHGELWSVGLEWDEAKGAWSKSSERRRPEPDGTNMLKGIEDALANIIYANDVQTRIGSYITLYGPCPGARVAVHAIEPGDFPGRGDP